MKLNILQMADLHYSRDKKDHIQVIIDSLIKDLNKLKNQQGIRPDIVLFCGDLLAKGENAAKDHTEVVDCFILPVLKAVDLDENRFFIVPGNHDVDQNKISEAFENGLSSQLNSADAFTTFYNSKLKLNNEDLSNIKRKFLQFSALKEALHNKNLILDNFFFDVFMVNVGELEIGILALNSAWRSSQFGSDEKRLIIGNDIFNEGANLIKDCHIKIGISHHPLEMLATWDQKLLKNSMAQNLDILCTGHIHDSDFMYSHVDHFTLLKLYKDTH